MNIDKLTVREAARRRIPLDGANAQALEGALSMTERERDEARAEVERLRALLPPSAHTGVRNGPGEGSWAVFAEKVVAERDELRHKLAGEAAHIKSLEGLLVEATRERDDLKAKLEAELPAMWREDIASLNECLERVERERDEARAEVEMLRGVGCREVKVDEPESGPCGVCLKCAEERGARWALERHGNPFATKTLAQYAEEICKDARSKT